MENLNLQEMTLDELVSVEGGNIVSDVLRFVADVIEAVLGY